MEAKLKQKKNRGDVIEKVEEFLHNATLLYVENTLNIL
jgi:hypothetical protein